MNAFTEFFKVSPEAVKTFAFFGKKNEDFYHLLANHAMKALGIVTKVVSEVIYYKLSFSDLSLYLKKYCNIFHHPGFIYRLELTHSDSDFQ